MTMQSVMETSIFTRRADALLTRAERSNLITLLAADPLAGDLVPGLGGIRKRRFAAGGRGKSGAFRVIYYVADESTPILALLLYGKNEQVDPTPDQRKAMLTAVERLKATHTKKA
jgi:mRNA-degrading endonuclease RelE of RelBE toxin-antitoxin system